jgi:hypothetical protein
VSERVEQGGAALSPRLTCDTADRTSEVKMTIPAGPTRLPELLAQGPGPAEVAASPVPLIETLRLAARVLVANATSIGHWVYVGVTLAFC